MLRNCAQGSVDVRWPLVAHQPHAAISCGQTHPAVTPSDSRKCDGLLKGWVPVSCDGDYRCLMSRCRSLGDQRGL